MSTTLTWLDFVIIFAMVMLPVWLPMVVELVKPKDRDHRVEREEHKDEA